MMASYLMTILLFFPNGDFKAAKQEVQIPACVAVNGTRVEDSTCGIKACVVMADAIAARDYPTINFQVICKLEE